MPCHLGKKCICNFLHIAADLSALRCDCSGKCDLSSLHVAARRAGRSIPVVSLPLRLPEAPCCNRNMHWQEMRDVYKAADARSDRRKSALGHGRKCGMFTPPQNRRREGLRDPQPDRPHQAGAGCGSSRHRRLGKGAGREVANPRRHQRERAGGGVSKGAAAHLVLRKAGGFQKGGWRGILPFACRKNVSYSE